MEKNKFRTAVEAYVAALEIVPDHDLHNIKLNMGLCKALVKLGRGKDAVMRCSLVLEMDGASLDALEQVLQLQTCYMSYMNCWSLISLSNDKVIVVTLKAVLHIKYYEGGTIRRIKAA